MDPLDAPTFDPQKTTPLGQLPLIPESLYGRFGKYHIIEKVGQGGMGAVYRAKDTILERIVAIKVPLLDSDDRATTLGRFSREAVAAAGLRHVSICPIFEFNEFAQIPFIVTPFVDGRPLEELLQEQGAWDAVRSLQLGVQLAHALEYAHQHTIVHRDIKPQNILIEPDGNPVILDFGLAKVANSNQLQWTQSGEVLGTPAYMPPEQIDSFVGPVGPACDIYALGMTLYRMMTGRTAFSGEPQFMAPAILMDPPRPPSTILPSRADLKHVDALLLCALAKKPSDRFPSMMHFSKAMQMALESLAARGASNKLPELRIVGTGHRYRPTPFQSSIRIGRQRAMANNSPAMANDLVIRADGDPERSLRISRQHLEIVSTEQGLGVIDRSKAGIRVNGRSAAPGQFEPIAIGDIINIAGVLDIELLSCESGNGAAIASSTPLTGFEATLGDFYKDGSN